MALLMIMSLLSLSSLSAILSFLVRLFVVVCLGLSIAEAISSLMASNAFSSAVRPSSCVLILILSSGGFLNSIGSPSGLLSLGRSLSVLYCLLTLVAKMLRSLSVSCGSALGAVGTNDRPLLRSDFYVLVSSVSGRLTMFSSAQVRQFGL